MIVKSLPTEKTSYMALMTKENFKYTTVEGRKTVNVEIPNQEELVRFLAVEDLFETTAQPPVV